MSLSNAAAAGHCPFAALAALAFREEEGGGADRPDHRERCPGRSTMRVSIGFAAALLLWASATALAQNAPTVRVTGTCWIGSTKVPLGGVTVQLLQTPYATVSDHDGHFFLGPVPAGQYVL